jgi:hypothetical protein
LASQEAVRRLTHLHSIAFCNALVEIFLAISNAPVSSPDQVILRLRHVA